jgi:hypothetical protein
LRFAFHGLSVTLSEVRKKFKSPGVTHNSHIVLVFDMLIMKLLYFSLEIAEVSLSEWGYLSYMG